jgi:hypothetical protein
MSTSVTEEIHETHTISAIAISQSQEDIEETPTDPFLPPQVGGTYTVNQNVIAGMGSASLDSFH